MGLFDTLSVQNERVTILNPMCYPNTWVTGFFSFTITGEVTMRAIRLVMTGNEVTVIVTRNKKHSSRHTSTNKLVEQYYVVSGSSKSSPSSGDLALKPGDYSIPFQFLVPPGAPVSGTEGGPSMSLGVSYSVTGYIDIPWGSDATASAPFQVGVCMPVGQVQQLMMPVGFGEPRRVPITCCCCSKGEVSFTATVNQGVIVLDRPVTLDVTLKIDNSRGEEPVDAVIVSVVNNVFVRAAGYARTARGPIATVTKADSKVAVGQAQEMHIAVPLGAPNVFRFPTWNGVNSTVTWFVEICLDIPYATDPKILLPIVAAQHLDETNLAPPLPVTATAPGSEAVPLAPPMRQDPNVLIEYRYELPGQLEAHAKNLHMLPPIGPGGQPAPYGHAPSSLY